MTLAHVESVVSWAVGVAHAPGVATLPPRPGSSDWPTADSARHAPPGRHSRRYVIQGSGLGIVPINPPDGAAMTPPRAHFHSGAVVRSHERDASPVFRPFLAHSHSNRNAPKGVQPAIWVDLRGIEPLTSSMPRRPSGVTLFLLREPNRPTSSNQGSKHGPPGG